MTSWEKHYVVGEVVEGGKGRKSASPQPKKKRRAWKFWLFFAFLTFCIGMGIGLVEDQEFEAVVDQAVVSIQASVTGEELDRHLWRHALSSFDIRYSDHFLCRMDCRGIDRHELSTALNNGTAIGLFVRGRQSKWRGEIKYEIVGRSLHDRSLKVFLSVNTYERQVTFISLWNDDAPKSQDPCGSNKCNQGIL